MKTAIVIRHTPAEGIAGFRQPIEAAGYEIRLLSPDDLGRLGPEIHTADLLVTMGGPMGVYERDAFPWIETELHILRERIGAGRPTLGVCLGSQMIAAALGAEVRAGPHKEVGFARITLSAAGRASPLRHLDGVPVLHWHGDTFALPDGVELLASSDLYPHQAFRRGNRLLALQCHPEMGEDPRYEAWIGHGVDFIAAAGTSAERLRADHAELGPPALAAGRAMLGDWLAALA